MTLTIGPPLLLALSIRILVNFLNPEHTSSISDYLLYGLWQGVLLYHTLIHLAECVFIVAIGILAVLAYNALGPNGFDATKCACMILGIALGVLVTNVLSMVLEDGGTAVSDTRISSAALATSIPLPETTTRRTRKVSFGRATTDREREKERERERERDRERHRHTSHRHTTTTREREPEPRASRHPTHHHRQHSGYDPALRDVISPVPTLAYSVDTAPSISIDSVSSSIDPKGTMSPAEREVAILRARASLADSERRRFKEERKWALSMGNKPRANQLAWQVKRYTALMESYHREADAKVVEAARAAAPQTIPFPSASSHQPPAPQPAPSYSQPPQPSYPRRSSFSQSQTQAQYQSQSQAYQSYSSQTHATQQASKTINPHPLVSVTVSGGVGGGVGGGAATTTVSRTRKRSGSSAPGPLKSAIREPVMVRR